MTDGLNIESKPEESGFLVSLAAVPVSCMVTLTCVTMRGDLEKTAGGSLLFYGLFL